jgi:hypothetical protein
MRSIHQIADENKDGQLDAAEAKKHAEMLLSTLSGGSMHGEL